MKRLFLLISFFSAIDASSFSQNFTYSKDFPKLFLESESKESPIFYPALKVRFLKEGEKFSKDEMLALLVGQTAQETYNAYGMVGLEKSFLLAEQFPADTIVKYGEKVLELNPVSLSLNFGFWKTYQKIQDASLSDVFKKRFDLLCKTILFSGDGTRERPYFVTSPIDGMVLITKYMGHEITTMGSGDNPEGYFLDILGFKNETGEKTLHFVIDHGMGGLSKMLMDIRQKR